ncbi:hypothetical protein BN1007_100266 [Klebsiella variicola]|nr:hypothetical protein BN1007_100266 [Klebsiella variicola]CTQ17021.1 hypothetical protein BN1200_520014 [Klebsiella variicola]
MLYKINGCKKSVIYCHKTFTRPLDKC